MSAASTMRDEVAGWFRHLERCDGGLKALHTHFSLVPRQS